MVKPIFSLIQRRPWPLIPVLGMVPLVSILLISQSRQSAPVAQETSTVISASPTANLAVPSPTTTPTAAKSVVKTPTASPKKSTQKSGSPAKPAANTSPASAAKNPKPQAKAKSTAPAKQQKTSAQASAAPISASAAERLAAAKSSTAIDSVLEIQVAIAVEANSLAVGTSTPGVILDTNGQVLRELPAESAYTAQLDGSGITLNSWQLPSAVYIEPTEGGLVYVGDRWYRGRLLLMVRPSGLLAVNHVLLRDYLYSVVGAEVSPSWPMAALKAQAIAARSYALTYYFKPATDFYHIGDDEQYQVYAGAEKEADRTYQAVNETAGEFISYRGGIVESLYAASDDIVIDAHGGRGMSQLGALKLAEEGYDYRQILGTYYPGTGLARIEVDQE
ncbi:MULTISPECIES: SpoIID/LytB domain-containing protein [Trichocoleus]|uniref:SpoIID/LytB domain-containing protein n=1 Tax=Trichocoleus desertorum GB2-A4 TaxID=2933944 RepID=A0ABV0JAU0_9CYAN|nr:SpoIID/LytB domain-containing protein [Trichocoleus sp. FACHB-46]MBD1863136.1 SpoIID/LytB domain-containing protein [Trichocoleus sp. FACHB-46]